MNNDIELSIESKPKAQDINLNEALMLALNPLEHVSVKKALALIEMELYKKLIHKLLSTATYTPEKVYIFYDKLEQFYAAINDIFSLNADFFLIPSEHRISKYNFHIGRNFMIEKLDAFCHSLKNVFTAENTPFIYELFARLLAIKMVEVIREFNIPALDCFTKTQAEIDLDTNSFFNYKPSFSTRALTLEEGSPSFWCYKEYSGQHAAQAFIQEELLNTGKNNDGSFQQQWETDTRLHSHVFAAIKHYLFNRLEIKKIGDSYFSLYIIAQAILRRSSPTAFRSRTIPEVLFYLNTMNILPSEGNRLFDSSIGWLNRFTGTMMANQGQGFKSYVGTDPNATVTQKAEELYGYFSNFLTSNYPQAPVDFHHAFLNYPAEELTEEVVIQHNQGNYFDLALTSPPFDRSANEKYALNQNQSEIAKQVWKRYETEQSYLDKFLIPLIRINMKVLRAGGVFALHFKNYTLLDKALKKLEETDKDLPMEKLSEGRYYPNFKQTIQNGREPFEKIFFFRRPNKIENIPLVMIADTPRIPPKRKFIAIEDSKSNTQDFFKKQKSTQLLDISVLKILNRFLKCNLIKAEIEFNLDFDKIDEEASLAMGIQITQTPNTQIITITDRSRLTTWLKENQWNDERGQDVDLRM